jgi:hypothetical protein
MDGGSPALTAIAEAVETIRRSLHKEGADLEVELDEDERRILVTLERKRIVCEECLVPEPLVQQMLKNALRSGGLGKAYKVETRNWLGGHSSG